MALRVTGNGGLSVNCHRLTGRPGQIRWHRVAPSSRGGAAPRAARRPPGGRGGAGRRGGSSPSPSGPSLQGWLLRAAGDCPG
eukprot:7382630-Alexandrium_andersonii.AAC.1